MENLRGVDLNLLVILDALLRERSVTRAAKRLSMTQPAVSHALGRLRDLFDDALLARKGRGMTLTPRAEALADPLARVLADVRRLASTEDAVPLERIERTLRLSMIDLAMTTLLPSLLGVLGREAPGLTIACLEWTTADQEIERLARGDVDLVLTGLGAGPTELRRVALGHVGFVGIARRGHPMFREKRPRPERQRFVMVSASGRTRGPLDGALAEQGRARRVVASVPQYTAVPPLVASTDLIAYVPEPLARRAPERAKLRTFSAPRALAKQPIDLAWHERHDDDVAHRFVRERFAAIARDAFLRRGG